MYIMKNKTFSSIISVTSWLYSGIILNIFDDAEYTLMMTLNRLTGIYKLIQLKPALFSAKTSFEGTNGVAAKKECRFFPLHRLQ